jgi:hypothetical protein
VNPLLVPNLIDPGNAVHVPGPLSLPWEVNDVPRGEVHHHFYKSAVAGDDRDYYVYTPPGYDPTAQKTIPSFICCMDSATTRAGGLPLGRRT